MTIKEIFELIDEDYAIIKKTKNTKVKHRHNLEVGTEIIVHRPFEGEVCGVEFPWKITNIRFDAATNNIVVDCGGMRICDTDSWQLTGH